jgi:hypothetical protein
MLVYSHAVPSRVDEEGRSWVRYYVERFAIGSDGTLRPLRRLNVPGVVVALRDGGDTIITLDRTWDEEPVDDWYWYRTISWLNALDVEDGRAVRTSVLRLGNDMASMVVPGDQAYLVRQSYDRIFREGYGETWESRTALATVDLGNRDDLRIVSELDLGGEWWTFATWSDDTLALSGGWGGGLALFDVSGDEPEFRRYLRTQGWSVSILEEGDTLFLSGGPYGIQQVSLTE